MNYKNIFLLILSLFFCSVVIFNAQFNTTLAATTTAATTTESSSTVVKLSNPLGTNSVPTLIGRIIDAILGIVGSLALVMFIYGGFTWMTASGNEQSVTKGKNILMWAAVGLAVIFLSYALVKFVIKAIGA